MAQSRTTSPARSESFARTWPIYWPVALAVAVATGSTPSRCFATNQKETPSCARRPTAEAKAPALGAPELGIRHQARRLFELSAAGVLYAFEDWPQHKAASQSKPPGSSASTS